MGGFSPDMTRRLSILAVSALVMSLQVPEGRGQVGATAGTIVSIAGPDGRTVLTNMGSGTAESRASHPSVSAEATSYRQLIDNISREHGVDPRLTQAVIEVESGFNPEAVSSKGALGLMQLVPATGKRFGVNNFFDPADNIRGGVRFLSFLIDKFDGNAELVLAAYNSGENLVQRLGRVPAIPETVEYIRRVQRAWARLVGPSPAQLRPEQVGVAARQGTSTIYGTSGRGGVLRLSNIGSRQ